MINVISISITVFMGLFAIFQASKYSKESEKINVDTKDMLNKVKEMGKNNLNLNKNIYLTNLFTIIELRYLSNNTKSASVEKDSIIIRKAYNFSEYSNNRAYEVFKTFPFFQANLYEMVHSFINSNEEKIEIDLDRAITSDNITSFIKTCDILFDYGILVYLHNW